MLNLSGNMSLLNPKTLTFRGQRFSNWERAVQLENVCGQCLNGQIWIVLVGIRITITRNLKTAVTLSDEVPAMLILELLGLMHSIKFDVAQPGLPLEAYHTIS